jgi:hypothetical protein
MSISKNQIETNKVKHANNHTKKTSGEGQNLKMLKYAKQTQFIGLIFPTINYREF